MKTCPKCNAELKPGAKFCHVCGFQIPQETSQENQQTIVQQQPIQTTNSNQNIMETSNASFNPVQAGGLIQRAKNIITKPKQEWQVINTETPDTKKILMTYAIPLMLIPAIAQFIGYSFIGYKVNLGIFGSYYVKSIKWGLATGITSFVGAIISVYLVALIIDMLAPSFSSEKNFGRSFQLAVYSWTPAWVAGIFYILPSLGIIAGLAGIYGLVLMYMGIAPLKKTPADKVTVYFIVALIVAIVVSLVVGLVMGLIVSAIYNPFAGTGLPSFGF